MSLEACRFVKREDRVSASRERQKVRKGGVADAKGISAIAG
jgi:hypothetical protein